MKEFLQKKKIIIFIALAAAIVAAAVGVLAIDSPSIHFEKLVKAEDHTLRLSSLRPVMIDGTMLVPAKEVFSELGIDVGWDEDRRSVKFVGETKDSTTPLERRIAEVLSANKEIDEEATENSVIVYVPQDSCKVVVMYNYRDKEDKNINVEKIYNSNTSAKIDENNVAYVPMRTVAECFGLDIRWDDENLCVFIPGADKTDTAEDVARSTETPSVVLENTVGINRPTMQPIESAEVPSGQTAPSGVSGQASAGTAPSSGKYNVGTYIGKFKITHYCTCTKCNGSWGSKTAYGGAIRPGVTIAVDPSVIKKLSWVYIDGYGVRLAEDVGGAIRGKHIDMAVGDHSTAMAMGVTYKDVWYTAEPKAKSESSTKPAEKTTANPTASATSTPSKVQN